MSTFTIFLTFGIILALANCTMQAKQSMPKHSSVMHMSRSGSKVMYMTMYTQGMMLKGTPTGEKAGGGKKPGGGSARSGGGGSKMNYIKATHSYSGGPGQRMTMTTEKSKGKGGEVKKPKTKSERTKEIQEKAKAAAASRNPQVKKSLQQFANATSKKDVVKALSKTVMQVSKNKKKMSEHEKRALSSSILKAMKSKSVALTADVVREMKYLALRLNSKSYRQLDANATLALLEIGVQGLRQRPPERISKNNQKVILSSLSKVVPPKNWDVNIGEKLEALKDVVINDKVVYSLSKAALEGIFVFLQKYKINCKKGPSRLMMAYLKKVPVKNFNGNSLRRLGKALCFLNFKQLARLPKAAVTDKTAVENLCRPAWTDREAAIVIKLAQNPSSFKNLATLSCDDQRIFANCWRGATMRQFSKLTFALNTIECFNSTTLPRRLRNVIAKQLRKKSVSMKNIGAKEAKEVIKAAGINTKQIKELSKAVLKEVTNEIAKQIKNGQMKNKIAVKAAAKLIVRTQVNDSNFRLDKISSTLIAKLTLSTLQDMPASKLGFDNNPNITTADSQETETETTTTDASEENEDEEEDKGVDSALAEVIIDKLKTVNGEINSNITYWKDALTNIKMFCSGFTLEDVKKIPDQYVPDFVSECKKMPLIPSSLLTAMASRYEQWISAQGNEALTEDDMTTLGCFICGLKSEWLLKTSDDETVRKAAIRQIAGCRELKYIPLKARQTLASVALAMLKITTGQQLTTDNIDDFGRLVKFIDIKIWRDVPREVIVSQSSKLGAFFFSDEVRQVFLTKIKEYFGAGGASALTNVSAEDFGEMAPLVLSVMTSSDIASINMSVIEANKIKIGQIDMTSNKAKLIQDKLSGATQSSRKRRSVSTNDLSNHTAGQIMEMGTRLYALSVDELKTIDDAVFKDVLDFIGKMTGFSKAQLEAWVAVLKRAYGSLTMIEDADLKRLKNIALGFSAADIDMLTLNNTEVISELSSINGYTSQQISAMYNEIKEDLMRPSVKHFTGEELSSLRQFATASNHSEMAMIPSANYKDATRELGEVDAWTNNHMQALKTVAVSAYGQVSSWTGSVVREIGAAIGGCTSAEISSIHQSKIPSIKPVALKQIPPTLFKELTIAQLQQMTPEQFSAVTPAQKNALPAEKLEAFNNASEANKTVDTSQLLQNETATSGGSQMATTVQPQVMPTGMTPSYQGTPTLKQTPTVGGSMGHGLSTKMPMGSGAHSMSINASMANSMYLNQNASRSVLVQGCFTWGTKCSSGSHSLPLQYLISLLAILGCVYHSI